jgi:hypothetical protein
MTLDNMRVAILGWGSLVWDARNLEIDKDFGWNLDGPKLPIEFARISLDGRLTLVIKNNKDIIPVGTYYAISSYESLDEAKLNLAIREGCGKNKIGYCTKSDEKLYPDDFDCKKEIIQWLSKNEKIDAVIWTNLKSNFKDQLDKEFSSTHVINYLKYLAMDKQVKAEEYIRRAPEQIKTNMRNIIESELGWKLIK